MIWCVVSVKPGELLASDEGTPHMLLWQRVRLPLGAGRDSLLPLVSTTAILVHRSRSCCGLHSRRSTPFHRSPIRRNKLARFIASARPCGIGHSAGLGLKPGDALKYVYDFGGWSEHRLTLEEVAAPETGATYPRIVAYNEPQYQYFQTCQGKRRKSRATWVYIECSSAQQQDVLVCKKCLIKEHEADYAEEVLY